MATTEEKELLPGFQSPDIKDFKTGSEEYAKSLFFKDGVSKISVVIAYHKNDQWEGKCCHGERFLDNLKVYGLQVEKEDPYVQVSVDHFLFLFFFLHVTVHK